MLPDLVGKHAERRIQLDQDAVGSFAALVDDHNPLHLDAAAAGASRFGRPIVHGMLLGSLFSGLISTELPGRGSIYVSQSLTFMRPVYVGDVVEARIICTSVDTPRSRLRLETLIIDSSGATCVRGQAEVFVDR